MTLLDSATAIIERLQDIETSTVLAKDAQAFQTRAEQIESLSTSLIPAIACASVMAAAGVPRMSEAPGLSALVARAAKLAVAFEADPKSIVNTQPPLDASFLAPLRNISGAIEAGLSQSWRAHINDILGQVPEELLKVIEVVNGASTEIRNIRVAQALGEQIATTVPQDGNALQAAIDEARRLREITAENLTSLRNIPEEVMTFFGLSVRRQARLGDVTETVREWLISNKMLEKFLVTLGG